MRYKNFIVIFNIFNNFLHSHYHTLYLERRLTWKSHTNTKIIQMKRGSSIYERSFWIALRCQREGIDSRAKHQCCSESNRWPSSRFPVYDPVVPRETLKQPKRDKFCSVSKTPDIRMLHVPINNCDKIAVSFIQETQAQKTCLRWDRSIPF